jgi:hypothetical protein
MIRPAHFDYNEQTAVNNSFQKNSQDSNLHQKALEEFDRFVNVLINHHIDVTIVDDTVHPYTPDSVFPNNWISFQEEATVCLYPMFAENRRAERKLPVLNRIREKFQIRRIIDFTHYETQHLFLEGTGSMVLDREKRLTYACLSPRTDEKIVRDFCSRFNYQPVFFKATDNQSRPVYHTNVMMCVADKYVVICLDSIKNLTEREYVKTVIEGSGKELIEISFEQMNHFAGNMLQVENAKGEYFLVMSEQAYLSLTKHQIAQILPFNPILYSDINHIETNGGGSARCMIAEIFLPLIRPE